MNVLPPANPHNGLEKGWPANDVFKLKDKGRPLTTALSQVTDPMVLAVSGAWGSGKSFFLKSWVGAHQQDPDQLRAKVIYFDAFEHDYLDDPLMSLLQAVTSGASDSATSKFIRTLKRLSPALTKAGLNIATLGAMRELNEVGDILASELNEAAQKALDDHWHVAQSQHVAMARFRIALQSMVADDGTPNKLVFVIDELDRCRPDYALRMLEVMKHFFEVSGVHFVLGVNLDQLAHSVRAVYGQDFDGEKYLQRFVQVVMPYQIGGKDRVSSLLASYYLRQLVPNALNRASPRYGENEWLGEVVDLIAESEVVTFRDMERLHTLGQINEPKRGKDGLLAGVMVLKVCRPPIFAQLLAGEDVSEPIRSFLNLKFHMSADQENKRSKEIAFHWHAALGKRDVSIDAPFKPDPTVNWEAELRQHAISLATAFEVY